MAEGTCSEAGCDRPIYARTVCNRCYMRRSRSGTLDNLPTSRPAPDTHVIDGEEWRPIPGVDGYEASSAGRIRSVDRKIVKKDGAVARHRGQVLRQSIPSDGENRPVVNIKGKARKVCHLVAAAFHGPRPAGALVLHWNDDPTDNCPGNLRYGTKAENSADALRNGRNHMAGRTRCPLDHPLDGPNLRPDVARSGYRGCLACSRARGYVATHPEADLQEIADIYFQRIMTGDTSPIAPHWRAAQTTCSRGHLLGAPNLRRVTPGFRGRGCLACHRASAYVQWRPGLDLNQVADRYYEEIMRSATG